LPKDRKGINLVVFDRARDAVLELLSGQVDALVYPAPVAMKIVRDAGIEDRIKIVGKVRRNIEIFLKTFMMSTTAQTRPA
jgi:ABC-type amino acid transport substrate-binding protein